MQSIKAYGRELRSLLSPAEKRLLAKLSTPQKIQDFLESFPARFARQGTAIIEPPRAVLKNRRAHCMEGAVLAAAALAYHDTPPLLMDFRTTPEDEDHVLAIFKQGGLWGAMSKTNHPVLRWRDPIYRTPRELAMSYAHEYFMWQRGDKRLGKKTLRAYSGPFDLRRHAPAKWWAAGDLDWLAEELDGVPHCLLAPKAVLKNLRKATGIEIKAMRMEEWPSKKKAA